MSNESNNEGIFYIDNFIEGIFSLTLKKKATPIKFDKVFIIKISKHYRK